MRDASSGSRCFSSARRDERMKPSGKGHCGACTTCVSRQPSIVGRRGKGDGTYRGERAVVAEARAEEGEVADLRDEGDGGVEDERVMVEVKRLLGELEDAMR